MRTMALNQIDRSQSGSTARWISGMRGSWRSNFPPAQRSRMHWRATKLTAARIVLMNHVQDLDRVLDLAADRRVYVVRTACLIARAAVLRPCKLRTMRENAADPAM